MTIRLKTTGRGGNTGYLSVRSAIAKDKHGYGKVVSLAREKMMQKLGRDPGFNVTANHVKPGSHFEKDGGKFNIGTRAENTAQSNRARAKKVKDKLSTK